MTTPDESLLDAWRICNRATVLLVESLPDALWPLALSGAPRRAVRNVAAHLHNCRGAWLKSLGKGAGIAVPASLDPKSATRARTVAALGRSGEAMLRLLAAGVPIQRGTTLRTHAHVVTCLVQHRMQRRVEPGIEHAADQTRLALAPVGTRNQFIGRHEPQFKAVDITGAEYARDFPLPGASGNRRTSTPSSRTTESHAEPSRVSATALIRGVL